MTGDFGNLEKSSQGALIQPQGGRGGGCDSEPTGSQLCGPPVRRQTMGKREEMINMEHRHKVREAEFEYL